MRTFPLTPAPSTRNRYGMNWIRKDKRLALYLRDGMACVYCGTGVESGCTMTLDHVVPRAHGGCNSPSNLVTSCLSCNASKGDKRLSHWASRRAVARVRKHTRRKLGRYRSQARKIMQARSWAEALEAATGAYDL